MSVKNNSVYEISDINNFSVYSAEEISFLLDQVYYTTVDEGKKITVREYLQENKPDLLEALENIH